MKADTPGYYHFIPGSFQVFDITGLDASRWDTGTCTHQIPGDPTLTYNLNVLNSQGNMILNLWTDSVPPDTSLPRVMPFCTVFQIPQAILDRAAGYQLIEGLNGPSMMIQPRAAQMGGLTTRPADGSTLGDQFSLGWTGGSGSVMHWVWYSRDGGTTWQPAGLPTDAASLTYDTDFLRAGNNISLQTISSDGFQQVVETINGLTMPNHPPQLTILSPTEGANAPQTMAWNLHGRAQDVEDGGQITGSWASSIDGALGTGNSLWGVTLSAGVHTITFSATDKGGLASSAQIHITVGTVSSADLALGKDSLRLVSGNSDPAASAALTLVQGVTNSLELSAQGVGVPITATVSLFITAPGESETPLFSQARALQPFSTGVWIGSFTPAKAGVYHLRGVIASSTLPDPNLTNNEYTWTFTIPASYKLYLPLIIR
jgi:hypothetical protein